MGNLRYGLKFFSQAVLDSFAILAHRDSFARTISGIRDISFSATRIEQASQSIPHVCKLDIGSPQINSPKRPVKENIRIDVQMGSINKERNIDYFFGKRTLVVVTLQTRAMFEDIDSAFEVDINPREAHA